MKNYKNSKNNNSKLTQWLLIFLIIGFIIIVAVVFIKQNTYNKEYIDELYSYMGSNNLAQCGGLFTYSDSYIDQSLTPEEYLICNSYLHLNNEKFDEITLKTNKKKNYCIVEEEKFAINTDNNCIVSKILASDLSDIYIKLYDIPLTEYINFNIDEMNICVYHDNYYYCGIRYLSEYHTKIESQVYRTIDKVIEKGDKLTIYDFFIRIEDSICYKSYTNNIYNKECTDNYDISNINKKYLKKYGAEYKHTYLKNDSGKYTWYSSEPVKSPTAD